MLAGIVSAPAAGAVSLEDILDTDPLVEELPADTRDLMEPLSPTSLPSKEWAGALLSYIEKTAKASIGAATRTTGVMILVSLFISMAQTLDTAGRAPPYALLAGVAAIGGAAVLDLDSYLTVGLDTLQRLSDYSRVLLPVLTSAAAASGAVTSATARYGATAVAMDVLLTAAERIVQPCICGYAALSLADAAVGNDLLRSAKKLVRTVCTAVLSLICTAFTAWISLTGILTGSADTLSARLAKTAVSTALPVVGGILSDAAGSLTAAAGVLRGSIGSFGVAAVTVICLNGTIALGIRYLAYRLAAAVCACTNEKRLSDLIGDMGSCFGMILSLCGAGGLMLFVSLYSLMRTVT